MLQDSYHESQYKLLTPSSYLEVPILTASQKRVYEFIQVFFKTHQHSPTLTEIAQGIGIQSKGVVHRYISVLVNEGLLHITPGKHRNLQLANSASHLLRLEGCIAAGNPIEAIVNNETLDIASLLHGPNRYALKVQGNSMVDEGILDGDIVVCEHAESSLEGKIVVALIDNQMATLKRIKYNSDQTITLLPANSSLAPAVYAQERITVQGIYIGLVRLA